MNLTLALYLIDVSKNISELLLLLSVFFGFLFMGSLFPFCGTYGSEKELGFNKFCKKLMVIGCCLFLTTSFIRAMIPEKETMYLMMGSEAAQAIVNNPEVKQIGGKVLTIINQKLDELSDTVKKDK